MIIFEETCSCGSKLTITDTEWESARYDSPTPDEATREKIGSWHWIHAPHNSTQAEDVLQLP